MYIPSHFAGDQATGREIMKAHSWALLMTSDEQGTPLATHLSLIWRNDGTPHGSLIGHMARANAHWQELEGAGEVLVVFSGPHAYVSPSWYANHPSVPTWNYAVVHAHGRARLLPPEALPGLLDRLSRAYEDARPSPWRMAGLPADYTAKMLPAIVGFEVAVERLEGKFKLSQNRRREDVDGVAAALEREGQPELAALMREHAPESR